jgi:phosphoribosylformimino-5-aminoimidazole carboxamide ribotide isomerase
MLLIPAIDLRNGRCVRLFKGDFNAETRYDYDPLDLHERYRGFGATWLHVVDLDGAKDGEPANLHHLERIVREVDVPVQFGGGLRSTVSVRRALAAGADRVVLGTAAYTDEEFLDDAIATWRARIVVAVDVRGGQVSVSGWTEEMDLKAEDVIERMQERGVSTFAYTSVDRDGMLGGIDLDEVRRISGVVRGHFLYSGGIGSIEDLQALRSLRLVNLTGVISGKALYEGRFTVADGQAALAER